MIGDSLIKAFESYFSKYKKADKTSVIAYCESEFGFKKDGRSVYMDPSNQYRVRFSYSASGTFSNVVLSLSTVLKIDYSPLIVAVIHPNFYELMLCNSTFIEKVSHSSKNLTEQKIRGSFLGSNIIKTWNGIENTPDNFDELFAFHQLIPVEENIARIVEATTGIVSTRKPFRVDKDIYRVIKSALEIPLNAKYSALWQSIKRELDNRTCNRRSEIVLVASREDTNVNIRGNAIEQLITRGKNKHSLGDVEFTVGGLSAAVDIKSVRENKASCPKLYNVDKFLKSLSRLRHHFIYFVFINEQGGIVTNLVNVLDKEMIELTRIQHHWAGRLSRGVTQLDRKFHNLVAGNWQTTYSFDRAKDFVDHLIAVE